MSEFAWLVLGVIAGYVFNEAAAASRVAWKRARQRRSWATLRETWATKAAIAPGLQVVQSGWRDDGTFSEDDVQLKVDGAFELDSELAGALSAKHLPRFAIAGYQNNLQLGVAEIDPIRRADDPAEEVAGRGHLLRVRLRTIRYFDFLMTNHLLPTGDDEDRETLRSSIEREHALAPVPRFANPISLGLSVFCQGGDTLVLGKRPFKRSVGGAFWADRVYNVVGEVMNLKDTRPSSGGVVEVSPWRTATRGLAEELGLSASDVAEATIGLHSFVWDKRILDYKFFGFAVLPLSEGDTRERWQHAPDRHETQELTFWPVARKRDMDVLVAKVVAENGGWASEASLCTVWSLVALGKLTPADVRAMKIEDGG